MIAIDNTLVSEELLEKKFVCDLTACKGACCVEGESGAPLEAEETGILEEEFENIKPFLRPEGIAAINKQGKYIVDIDGDFVTPLVRGAECAYATFDERGIAKCGIEQAFNAGKTHFKKPVSCHLYPIRITKLPDAEALNYHYWPVCDPARSCGARLDVKVYRFLKEAIIRKYGEEYFEKLEAADGLIDKSDL